MTLRVPSLRRILPVVLAALVAFVAGHYWAARNARQVPAIAGFLWPQPPRLEPFRLTADDGGALSEADLRGHWTLLFFGYTHCPDICPTTLATLKTAYASLRALPDFAAHGQVLFVSVDAERDTPAALRRYVTFFDARFRAATAPPERLHQLTRQLAAESVRISGEKAGEVWFDHSAAILLIAPNLDVVGEFLPPHDASALARDTRGIIEFIDS